MPCNKIAFVWMDRDRRYIIASVASIDNGTPYERRRLQQVRCDSVNGGPQFKSTIEHVV